MRCPKCRGHFETVVYRNIQVERCTTCQGLWFDQFERRLLRDRKGSELVDTGAKDRGKQFNEITQIRCPVDGSAMNHLNVPDQPHIGYERCPQCQGAFFDAGEFSDYKSFTLVEYLRSFFAG